MDDEWASALIIDEEESPPAVATGVGGSPVNIPDNQQSGDATSTSMSTRNPSGQKPTEASSSTTLSTSTASTLSTFPTISPSGAGLAVTAMSDSSPQPSNGTSLAVESRPTSTTISVDSPPVGCNVEISNTSIVSTDPSVHTITDVPLDLPPTGPEEPQSPPTGIEPLPAPPIDVTWDVDAMENVDYEVITITVNGVEKTVHIPVPKSKANENAPSVAPTETTITFSIPTTASANHGQIRKARDSAPLRQPDVVPPNRTITPAESSVIPRIKTNLLYKKNNGLHARQLGILKHNGGRWGRKGPEKRALSVATTFNSQSAAATVNSQSATVLSSSSSAERVVPIQPSPAHKMGGQLVSIGGTPMFVLTDNAPGPVTQPSSQVVAAAQNIAIPQATQASNTQLPIIGKEPSLLLNPTGGLPIVLNSPPVTTVGQPLAAQQLQVNTQSLGSSAVTPGSLTSPTTLLQLAPGTTSGSQMIVLPPGFSLAPALTARAPGNVATTTSATAQTPIILQPTQSTSTPLMAQAVRNPSGITLQTSSGQTLSKSLLGQPFTIQAMPTNPRPPHAITQATIPRFAAVTTAQVANTPTLSQQPVRIQFAPTVPTSQIGPFQIQLAPANTQHGVPQQPTLVIRQPGATIPASNTPLVIGPQPVVAATSKSPSVSNSPVFVKASQITGIQSQTNINAKQVFLQGLNEKSPASVQVISPGLTSSQSASTTTITPSIQTQNIRPLPVSIINSNPTTNNTLGTFTSKLVSLVSKPSDTLTTSIQKSIPSKTVQHVLSRATTGAKASLPVAVVAPTGTTVNQVATTTTTSTTNSNQSIGMITSVVEPKTVDEPASSQYSPSAVYVINKNTSSGLTLISPPHSPRTSSIQLALSAQQISELQQKKMQKLVMHHTKMMSAPAAAAKRIKQMKNKAQKTAYKNFPSIKPKQGLLHHPLSSPAKYLNSPNVLKAESSSLKKSSSFEPFKFSGASHKNKKIMDITQTTPNREGDTGHSTKKENILHAHGNDSEVKNDETVLGKPTWEVVSESDEWSPSSDESSGSEYDPGANPKQVKRKKSRRGRKRKRNKVQYFPEEPGRVTRKCAMLLSYFTDTESEDDSVPASSPTPTPALKDCSVIVPRLALRRRNTIDLSRKEVEFENCVPWKCKLCERAMFGASVTNV